jgi:putative flippase GtrA
VTPEQPLPSPDMIEPSPTISDQGAAQRVGSALSRRSNWEQLGKFVIVGASGYVVNLAVYTVLLDRVGLYYLVAAVGSFLVAVANNYTLNRLWTFRDARGHYGAQGWRFLVVSTISLGANLVVLHVLVSAGLGQIVAQAVAIVLVTPLNFIGNKLWSFRLP